MADIVADIGLGFFDDGSGLSSYSRFCLALQRQRIKYLKAFDYLMAESAINGEMGRDWFDALHSDPARAQKAYNDYMRARSQKK